MSDDVHNVYTSLSVNVNKHCALRLKWEQIRLIIRVNVRIDYGDFIGQVTNVYASGIQNDGEIFYRIQYGDGNSEDFDEKELEEGVALYYRIQKRQNRNEPLLNRSFGLNDTSAILSYVSTDGNKVTNIPSHEKGSGRFSFVTSQKRIAGSFNDQ